jgi:hypothetical protein
MAEAEAEAEALRAAEEALNLTPAVEGAEGAEGGEGAEEIVS